MTDNDPRGIRIRRFEVHREEGASYGALRLLDDEDRLVVELMVTPQLLLRWANQMDVTMEDWIAARVAEIDDDHKREQQ